MTHGAPASPHGAPASSSGERLMGLLGRAGREAFISPTSHDGGRSWADGEAAELAASGVAAHRDGESSQPQPPPARPQTAASIFADSQPPTATATATRSASRGQLMADAAADAAEFLAQVSAPATTAWTNIVAPKAPAGGRPPRAASAAHPPASTDADSFRSGTWSSRIQSQSGGGGDSSSCGGSVSPGSDGSAPFPGSNMRVFVGKLSAASTAASVRAHFEHFLAESAHPLGPLAVLDIYLPAFTDDGTNKWRPSAGYAHRGFAFVSLADAHAVALIASAPHVVDGRPVVIDAVAPRGTRFTNRGRLNAAGATSTVIAVQALAEQQATFSYASERPASSTPAKAQTPPSTPTRSPSPSVQPPHMLPPQQQQQQQQYFHPSALPTAQLHPSAALSSAIALLGFLPMSTQSELVSTFYLAVVGYFAGMQAELAQQNHGGFRQ
jgi:hypothetical protein